MKLMTNDAAFEQNLLKDEDFERALYRQSYRNKVFLIIKIILFCVILLGVGTYPLYPASQIRGLELQGNYLLSKDDVLDRLSYDIYHNYNKNELTDMIIINDNGYLEFKKHGIAESSYYMYIDIEFVS